MSLGVLLLPNAKYYNKMYLKRLNVLRKKTAKLISSD